MRTKGIERELRARLRSEAPRSNSRRHTARLRKLPLEDCNRQQQDEADPYHQQARPVLRQAKETEAAPTRLKCRTWD